MNRSSVLRRARGLRRLARNPGALPEEAAAARARLEELCRKHHIVDGELREPDEPLPHEKWTMVPINCPALVVDFVAAVISAAGGGCQPAGKEFAVIAGPPGELPRLRRLGERLTQLFISTAATQARQAVRWRRPFCVTSLWAGLAQGLIEQLRARAAGGAAGEQPRAKPVQQEEPSSSERERPEAPPASSRALVLFQPPADRPHRRQRQVDIANPLDAHAGAELGRRFVLDAAGDLAGAQSTGPQPEAAAQTLERAQAWMDAVGVEMTDNPVVSAFVSAILGGCSTSQTLRDFVTWSWSTWQTMALRVRAHGFDRCRYHLMPEVADPRPLLLGFGEAADQDLYAWCKQLTPRLWRLERDFAEAEAERAAQRKARLDEDMRRWHARQEEVFRASTWTASKSEAVFGKAPRRG